MKFKFVILSLIVIICVAGDLVCAQNNVPSPYEQGIEMGKDMEGGVAGPVTYETQKSKEWMEDLNFDFSDEPAARCLVKISFDPSVFSFNYRFMRHLWFSAGVWDKARYKILNENHSAPVVGELLHIQEADMPGQKMFAFGINRIVDENVEEIKGATGKEKEILAAAVENLKSALSQLDGRERERLREQLVLTEARCAEMEAKVADMQEKIRAITQGGATDRQDVQKKIVDLRDSLAEIGMNIQYAEVRIDEFAKQQEEVRLTIEKALAADTVIEELKSIVKGAEEAVAMYENRFKAGMAPAEDVQGAKEKLTRARIELAKRIEEVRDKAGQKQLAEIDGSIGDMASSISKFKLTNNFKTGEYGSAVDRLKMCDEMELLEMKLDATKRSFHEALNAHEDLQNRLRMLQPLSVTVIGMD